MGLQLNKTLTTQSGLTIPVDNVIISSISFPIASLSIDQAGDLVVTRRICYTLFNYISVAEIQKAENDSYIKGGSIEIPAGYEKIMTPAEYAAILADGSLAEVWLKEYVDGIMGAGTATVIDPYV